MPERTDNSQHPKSSPTFTDGPVHVLECKQTIRTNLDTCWAFFSNPHNLSRITPPELGFKVQSNLPEQIYEGLMVIYRVSPLWHIPITWLTEITHVDHLHYFVDEQRIGPYSIWHHEHFFTERSPNEIEIRDLVHYRLPFYPFSNPIHHLVVKPQLNRIFSYRYKVIETVFA